MKFKNVSNKVKMFNKDNNWIEVYPNEIVELNGHADLHEEGLELVIESTESKPIESIEIKLDKSPEEEVEEEFIEVVEEKETFKTEEEIKNMTKDEINDYASVIGLKEISTRMKKQNMIKRLIEYIKGLIQ